MDIQERYIKAFLKEYIFAANNTQLARRLGYSVKNGSCPSVTNLSNEKLTNRQIENTWKRMIETEDYPEQFLCNLGQVLLDYKELRKILSMDDIIIHSRIWWKKKQIDMSLVPNILRHVLLETGIYKKGPDYLTTLLVWSYLNKEKDESDYSIIKDRILLDIIEKYGDNFVYQYNIGQNYIIEIDSKDKLIWLLYNILDEDTQNCVIEKHWSGVETFWLPKEEDEEDMGSTFWKGSNFQTEDGLFFTILLSLPNGDKPIYLNLGCTITPQKEYKMNLVEVFHLVKYKDKHYFLVIGHSSNIKGYVRFTLDDKEEILTVLSKQPCVMERFDVKRNKNGMFDKDKSWMHEIENFIKDENIQSKVLEYVYETALNILPPTIDYTNITIQKVISDEKSVYIKTSNNDNWHKISLQENYWLQFITNKEDVIVMEFNGKLSFFFGNMRNNLYLDDCIILSEDDVKKELFDEGGDNPVSSDTPSS